MSLKPGRGGTVVVFSDMTGSPCGWGRATKNSATAVDNLQRRYILLGLLARQRMDQDHTGCRLTSVVFSSLWSAFEADHNILGFNRTYASTYWVQLLSSWAFTLLNSLALPFDECQNYCYRPRTCSVHRTIAFSGQSSLLSNILFGVVACRYG